MPEIKLHSFFRKRAILVDDHCGCRGGIYEEEITEHGFNGERWVKGYKVKCSDCGKVLPEIKAN